MDLFYGQLKSRVQCGVCSHVSVTFDPFNVLSLPIPQLSKPVSTQIKLLYYPQNLGHSVLELTLDLNSERAQIEELQEAVRNLVIKHNHSEGNNIAPDKVLRPIIVRTNSD